MLLSVAVGLGGCEDELQPGTPYRAVRIGMAREQVWRFYGGKPNGETLIYGKDLAHFANGRLQWSITNKGEETGWPVKKEMSRAEVEAILGKPTKVCEDYLVGNYLHHWFCYRDGKVVEKSTAVGPVP